MPHNKEHKEEQPVPVEEPQIDPEQDELFAGDGHDGDLIDIPPDDEKRDTLATREPKRDMIARIDEEL